MRRRGFTLIELLVVIAIISILAGFLVAVVGRAMEKSRRQSTQGTIQALLAACDAYKNSFNLYPDLNKSNQQIGNAWSSAPSSNQFVEWNERLMRKLESDYEVDEQTRGPFAPGNAHKGAVDGMEVYIDAWANAIKVAYPGYNHTGETPPGPNNSTEDTPPDIYSMGTDSASDDAAVPTVGGANTCNKCNSAENEDNVMSWRPNR